MNNMKILEPLAVVRAKRGMNQNDLSHLTGMTPATINRIEKGVSKPRDKTRRLIENVLDSPVDWDMTQQQGYVKRKSRTRKHTNNKE